MGGNYFVVSLLLLGQFFGALSSPNIVFIVADDLGFNDVGFHGSTQIPTPNIDALASSGIVLNQYYASPLCTPSRSALMTGKHAIHTGMQYKAIGGQTPYGLPLEEKLVPQYLKELGYQTHAVGKWHLGHFKQDYLPTNRGFDSHFGYWLGFQYYYNHTYSEGDMWGLDLHDGLTPDWSETGNYATHLFTRKSEEVIDNHDPESGPLFLYVAHLAVHSANDLASLEAPQETIDLFQHIEDENRRIYAAMTYELDKSVGRITAKLLAKNLLDNTIIVFTSDNGGPAAGFNRNAASNWPLKGVKNTPWEGGVRVPGLLWSSQLETPGRVYANLMDFVDWLPTLYSAAGANSSSLQGLDGVDQWPSLLGQAEKPPRTKTVHNIDYYLGESAYGTARQGPWKIVNGTNFNGTWDDWFGPSGRPERALPATSIPYDELITQSEAAMALQSIGAKRIAFKRLLETAVVNCPPVPSINNCDPQIKPCLFQIETDPCEHVDVSSENPTVYAEMIALLDSYRQSMVPSRYQESDPRANPKYYGDVWTHWADFLPSVF